MNPCFAVTTAFRLSYFLVPVLVYSISWKMLFCKQLLFTMLLLVSTWDYLVTITWIPLSHYIMTCFYFGTVVVLKWSIHLQKASYHSSVRRFSSSLFTLFVATAYLKNNISLAGKEANNALSYQLNFVLVLFLLSVC